MKKVILMAGLAAIFGATSCGDNGGDGGGGQKVVVDAPKLDTDPAYVIVPETRDVIISWKANFNATDYEVKLAGGTGVKTGNRNSYTFKAAELGYGKTWEFGVRTFIDDNVSEWSQGSLISAEESMVSYFAGTWGAEPTKLKVDATIETPNFPTLFGEVRKINMTDLFESDLFTGGAVPAVGNVEFVFAQDAKVGNRLYLSTEGSSLIQWLPDETSAFLKEAKLDVGLDNRVAGSYGEQEAVTIDLKSEANGYEGVSLNNVAGLGDLLGLLTETDLTGIGGDNALLNSITTILGTLDETAILNTKVQEFVINIDDTSFKGEMTDSTTKKAADMTVALEGRLNVTFNSGSTFATGFSLLYPKGIPVTFEVVAPCTKVK